MYLFIRQCVNLHIYFVVTRSFALLGDPLANNDLLIYDIIPFRSCPQMTVSTAAVRNVSSGKQR